VSKNRLSYTEFTNHVTTHADAKKLLEAAILAQSDTEILEDPKYRRSITESKFVQWLIHATQKSLYSYTNGTDPTGIIPGGFEDALRPLWAELMVCRRCESWYCQPCSKERGKEAATYPVSVDFDDYHCQKCGDFLDEWREEVEGKNDWEDHLCQDTEDDCNWDDDGDETDHEGYNGSLDGWTDEDWNRGGAEPVRQAVAPDPVLS